MEAFEPGKETISNDSINDLSRGISGTITIPLTGSITLTDAQAAHFVLILTGALTAHVNVTVPADSRVYIVDNRTTGAFNVTLYPSAGGGVAAAQGERTLVYCDGSNVYPVASGAGGGGGSGAPTDATYLVGNGHALLSAERVVTSTSTIGWDLTVTGQAQAYIPDDAVTLTKMQPIATQKLLGRYTTGTGDIELITPGTGLTLDTSGNLNVVSTGGQPADATLDALAALVTAADRVPLFTGVDTATVMTVTAFIRTLLDDADAVAARTTLGVVPGTHVQAQDATLQAIANLATAANQMLFFTGTDTASLTPITSFARSLLDDNNANQARQTLGITSGGTPSIPFTALLDVPTSYVGQGGKTVAVRVDQTGLEFVTGASGFQPLDATLTALAALATAANTVPLFTGVDVVALMTVTAFARTLLDDSDAVAMQATLGLVPGTDVQPQDATLTALAGMTTGADLMPYFTALDAAQTTTLTSFARTLLDDPDAAAARTTLGITEGTTTLLALTDTPDAYTGHAAKLLAVKTDETGVEFITPTGGGDTESIQDIVGAMATDSSTINFSYDDTAGTFTAVVQNQPYDVGGTWVSTIPASQVMLRYPFPRAVDFPAGLTDSRGVAAVAATASTTIDIRKNGSSVGSMVFAAAGTTATFTMASATNFAAGDILTLVAPASPDATLADLGWSLAGTRV